MGTPAPQSRLRRRFEKQVERKGLRPRFATGVIVLAWGAGVVVFGVLERLVDPNTFDNVWIAMWWAIQTVTTVGYGDIVPGSTVGKVIASLLMLGGLSLYAVVTGVITSVFIARARAERGVARADPALQKLEEMIGQVQAMKSQLARSGPPDGGMTDPPADPRRA